PPQFHEKLAVLAVRAGKHVLVEKPMAATVEACRRMVEAAQDSKRLLTVGFNHRYFPALKLVRDAVQSGELGELRHVRAYAGHMGLQEFKSPWMYDANVMGGGALMDNGIHILDLCRYIAGDFREVYGHTLNETWKLGGAEDNAMALFRSDTGVVCSLHASWTEWKGYRFHVEAFGDRGMARAYYAPQMATVITMDKPGGQRTIKRHFYPANIVREKLKGWQTTTVAALAEELDDFVAVAEGKPGSGRIATGIDGIRSIETGKAVYASSKAGRSITLDPLPAMSATSR
ncbi:MAG: Gfo/Idh/MocA family oxidoreductase, partial [Alphaproteobacteria bacterium]|nr:Gfo/Idh/MocA family oxidoreductase [Alphaproteobacteria bacterium]